MFTMSRMKSIVKLIPLAFIVTFVVGIAPAGETDAPKPHMMYFYNPSCRLCTKTNEVVGAAEEKYTDAMSHQRFNIADPDAGTENVLYMFDLLDEMEVPEGDNITLVVFLGYLVQEGDDVLFEPRKVLVEGEEIIPKLDGAISEFLNSVAKGGKPLDMVQPAGFFLRHGAGLACPS